MKLTFKNDTFKILQIADTQEGRKVSPDTLALISAALDREEPDLVVYSCLLYTSPSPRDRG